MKKLLPILVLSLIFLGFTSCDKKELDQEPAQTAPIIKDSAYTTTLEFPSGDGLMVTADIYHVSKTAQTIVLCHQANWSRGEYKEIAPKLNDLGFNCIAIDQRSGNEIKDVINETNKKAVAAGKATTFNDAKQDIVAAVNYASQVYDKKVYLWGSSYSSSLVLIVAKENANVKKVLSFSPGEYLKDISVKNSIQNLNKPAFLTSSKAEEGQTKPIYDAIASSNKVQFVPKGDGDHGSRALWESKPDHAEYWVAVKAFLGK